MEVLHAQVAQKATSESQLLQMEANLDLEEQAMSIHWYNISKDGNRAEEHFASTTVYYEDSTTWQEEWERVTHLVQGRIEALIQMAANGSASKLSKNLAYTLFKNVVDYADKYRGMESVVMSDYEAFADVNLVPERHGTWHTPPHWIDSVSHLAGLIMNGSDASNTKDYFYVTPGCDTFRLSRPLEPGMRYRSYVRMSPTKETNMYAGDVYIFQDDKIVGMVGQIKFRRVPRMLMDQFFSAPDAEKKGAHPPAAHSSAPSSTPATTTAPSKRTAASKKPATPTTAAAAPTPSSPAAPPVPPPSKQPEPEPTTSSPPANSLANDCLNLIARETGLSLSELAPEITFVEIGVDSLMSLVLSEKFRNELQVEVKSSVFIECPTVGELTEWVDCNC